jgi:hypothetical protein
VFYLLHPWSRASMQSSQKAAQDDSVFVIRSVSEETCDGGVILSFLR